MKQEKQKYYIIYQTTNKVNGKIYVGKHITENLDDGYLGSGKYLRNAIEKYGVENFERTVLFFCETEDEMNAKEKEIVNEEFLARKDTYNLKIGGDGGWDYVNDPSNNIVKGFQWINEHKLNNKANQCYRTRDLLRTDPIFKNEFSKSISNGLKNYFKTHDSSWLGKKHKEETKEKIGMANSIHQKGSGNSHYGMHWWINPETGETHPFKDEDVPNGWIRGRTLKNKH